MLAYVKRIQRLERVEQVETLTHQKWSGAELIDRAIQIVTGGMSSTNSMGKEVTEKQFVSTTTASKMVKEQLPSSMA